MHGQEPVSTTQEMYLKVLLELSETKPIGRVRDIAKELGVTPGTVSLRLGKLKELGYVEQERYGGVLLTPAGEAIARCVRRRFETLKTLLVEVFGQPKSGLLLGAKKMVPCTRCPVSLRSSGY